jgi:hypothetical protein
MMERNEYGGTGILYKHILWLLIFQSQIVFASGWNDYEADLPHGYTLAQTNASSVFIMAPGSVQQKAYNGGLAVPSKIIGLKVYDFLVVGRLISSPDADGGNSGPPGFFILDTEKDKVQLGLDKVKWLESLKKLGIAEEPLLKFPKSFRSLDDRLRSWGGIVLFCAISIPIIFLKYPIISFGIVIGAIGAIIVWQKFIKRKSV